MGWAVSFGEIIDKAAGVLDVDEIVEHWAILKFSVAVEVPALELAFVNNLVEMDQLTEAMEKSQTVLSFVGPSLVELDRPVSTLFLALLMFDQDRFSLAIVNMIAFLGPFRPVFLAVLLDGEILAIGMRIS